MLPQRAHTSIWEYHIMETTNKDFIIFQDVTFSYFDDDAETAADNGSPGDETAASDTHMPRKRKNAVENVSFSVGSGEFLCIIGNNGSGKSTLAKLMNGLLVPGKGTVISAGFDTKNDTDIWKVRRLVGIVFQNPDNQIIATSVEDDVAFGLENIGVPRDEMIRRVDEALAVCGISDLRQSEPHLLSGGQKQRVSIAGIIAMKPACIVFDESTAMLDPKGRQSVMDIIKKLNKEEHITVVLITHHMDEIVDADNVIVMDKGRIVKEGSPADIFSDKKLISELSLELPPAAGVFESIEDFDFGMTVLSPEQGVEALMNKLNRNFGG